MKALLVTYDKEKIVETCEVEISDLHDFSSGPYADTIPFSVGSNQNIIEIYKK